MLNLRKVLDCASPPALWRCQSRGGKAAEDCRSPRRCRAHCEQLLTHDCDYQQQHRRRRPGHSRHQAAAGNSRRAHVAGVTLGALALAIILFVLWKYFQKQKQNVPIAPPIPAHVRAKQKLDAALALIAQPKPFVTAVSDTARTYLEERFDFHAPERTTEEFLRELGGTKLLLPEQKESLGKFLGSCDLVKFAKYEPGEKELRGLHSSAVQLIEETEPRPLNPESKIQN